jgi:bifunctional DNA-binding transcriptional regulator/antitoxin component of YhaV-PrlF toxin-antitoxin module
MNSTEPVNSSIKVFSLELQTQGKIVIPQDILNTLQIDEGETLALVQVGDFILLTSKLPLVDTLTEKFISLMDVNQVSLNELLDGLQQERQFFFARTTSQCVEFF